jgi:hypothetical protein
MRVKLSGTKKYQSLLTSAATGGLECWRRFGKGVVMFAGASTTHLVAADVRRL